MNTVQKIGVALAMSCLLTGNVLSVFAATGMPSINKVDVKPIAKIGAVKPGAWVYIAPARQIAIANTTGARLKAGAFNAFLKTLTSTELMMAKRANDEVSISIDQQEIIPVAFLHSQVTNIQPVLREPLDQFLHWHCNDPVLTKTGENSASVGEGESVIFTRGDTVLDADNLTIAIKAGTASLISASNGVTRVVNLSDHAKNSVVVFTPKHKLALHAGQECIIAPNDEMLQKACHRDGCGRRFQQVARTEDGFVLRTCQISVASFLKTHNLLRQVYLSKDKEDARLAGQLLKTAICLAHCSAGKQAYTYK
jgi:hypothetical protein